MSVAVAGLMVGLIQAYAAAGVAFALLFVTRWVGRLDPTAHAGTWGFRVLIVPGVIAFWPLLAYRLLTGARMPPDEWTAHRRAAR